MTDQRHAIPDTFDKLGEPARLHSGSAHSLAIGLGLVVAGIGALTLFGWFFDLPTLKTILPGLASMKVNTSLSFLLGGGALALLVPRHSPTRGFPLHVVVAWVIGGIALLTLVEYLLAVDLGIDDLFIADRDLAGNPHPGRMSLVTAVNFLLFAGALGTAGASSRSAEAAFVAFGTLGLLISLCALVGYAYGVPLLYTPVPGTAIAVHAAFAFALLFFGIAAVRPELGWASLLASRTPGGGLLRALLPTVLLGPVLFGWAVLYGARHAVYDVASGIAFFTILGGALMAGIVWHFGRRANRFDETLRSRQQLYDTVIASALDGFILMDSSGRVVEWNQQAEKIFGWAAAEAVGRPVDEVIIPSAYREAHRAGLARYLATGEARLSGRRAEVQGMRRDGTEFPLELVITPIRVDGHVVFSGFLRDLSDRRRTEAQLRQAQRLEAVGQLTGGVAHDFNNLLTVIIGSLDLALERVASPMLGPLANALKAAERGATLIKQLLAFSRRQTLAPQQTDLNLLIEEMSDVLHRTLGDHVEVELELAAEIWPALTDRAQVENALLNLVINARDAMPEGGKLIIETMNAPLDDVYAAQNMDIAPGDYVMVAVTDTGSGMEPAVLERVFEPFFSTKEVGKGTGLGLSMVYGFVKQSGGHVKIYSEVGLGTTVRLYLPRAEERATTDQPRVQPEGETQGGGETILVVEDSEQVRALVTAQLEDLGYSVIEAGDGPEALALLARGKPIDLLFTDVVMPGGMTGRMLADEARRRRPGLRVLFTSGYTENSIVHQGRLDDGVNFLSKPYRRRDLAEKLRRVLDAAP